MSSRYGLVVCGGKSSRMGTDKSLVNYHGKPQRYHLYELMKPHCERVFISCNALQVPDIPSEYEVLVDDPEYGDIGPMAALLTAFKQHPEASFMVVGCDYPFFSQAHIEQLSKATLQSENAAAFYNADNEFYEPLLAGYQSIVKHTLELNFRLKNLSLQRILKEVSADIIEAGDEMAIQSIDTIDGYEKVMLQLYKTNNNNTK
ncbi:molybdenum cofactor guanylyltransferase [Polluticoccus soli]|uniref:molybdenum cofactor guanylyltransferase n=1 Tax=Polluticoccus soli TaxID=3034150 RepID=UPI0023E2F8D0|nr:molybdenum cofactor guanylyltransferase [Flavipsychrobacter sp. JY13-12]